jgi:Na+-transporting methylmalonyl-CoA/oxaloacetate decarboxylase gamma subunit
MNEMILMLLAVVGVFSLVISVVLLNLGKIIDRFPPRNRASRTRSITGPVESTKIAVVLFWILFFPSAWAVLQEGIVTIILGITLLFAICLFLLTAVVFSFAVLSSMGKRKNETGEESEE